MTLQALASRLYRQLDLSARYEDRDMQTILKALKEAQAISANTQDLKAHLSQPRAVLMLCREVFEKHGNKQCIRLADSGIATLTRLIGDKAIKPKKRRKK